MEEPGNEATNHVKCVAIVWFPVSIPQLWWLAVLIVWTQVTISSVPRSFPHPVFDRLKYAKTKAEGLGERVTCMTSGRRDSFSQAFHLHFCILQAIKNWRREWPGNEAKTTPIGHVQKQEMAVKWELEMEMETGKYLNEAIASRCL